MAAWLAESSDVRPLPLRQPPATPVPQASPATVGTHRPGPLAAACPLRWPGTAPPRPEGGSNPRKTGDLRTRKTQGPLSLSPPLSDVRPPLATPTQHTPSLSLAASPAAAWTPFRAPRPPSGPQGALCPTSQAGQARTLCPPQGLLSRLAGGLCARPGQVSTSEQSELGCGHLWTLDRRLRPAFTQESRLPPALCHAKSQQQRPSGEPGVARSRDTGAPWRRRRPQEEIVGLGTSEWERSRRPTPGGGGVLLEQRQDWGGAGRVLGETCVEPEDSRKASGPGHMPGPPVNLPLLHVRILRSEEVKGHAQGWKGIEAGL